ncbi:putative sulfate exporter family transporter [Mesorhizobium calcicola]|uniref:Sulfate exporter family transporter n=1 Tax=Mesorhizobium calcicola TaxID=1300310 RepID=A0ABW4WEL2_9HYPH
MCSARPPTPGPAVAFSQRRLLRFAIVLLVFPVDAWPGGVRSAPAGVGIVGAVRLAPPSSSPSRSGRLIGVDAKLAQLIAAGTSICGASAIVATKHRHRRAR